MTVGQYIIYHLPGKKVGCTENFQQRSGMYRSTGYLGEIEILETVTGTAQEAGDIEWTYADTFGYPRSHHYVDVLRRFKTDNFSLVELAFYLRAQAWEAKKKKPTLAPTSPNSELLTIKDVARELGVGYRLAQTAINTGQIPSVVI